jgi:hypothetical protein
MKVRIKQVPSGCTLYERWNVEVRRWFVWCLVDYFDAKEQALACAHLLKHPQIEEVK